MSEVCYAAVAKSSPTSEMTEEAEFSCAAKLLACVLSIAEQRNTIYHDAGERRRKNLKHLAVQDFPGETLTSRSSRTLLAVAFSDPDVLVGKLSGGKFHLTW